ncbi:EVE domain-containing protein [Calidithermus chliarophilus]|uniref:EVE domain-containing protein n=1 Tax=Calidithermus chliarophilus TaxID=52023 RepID=UPI000425CC4C|nr:EVE domain-containing protein [Calidithermus chliarophilus]
MVEPTREGATALKVGHADRDRATWIFQANPALYDIHRSLKLEAREWWGCLQHTGRIRAGDRVLIWISGPRAGIYAVGELETGPSLRPDSPVGLRYWTDPVDGMSRRPRALVRYDRVLLDDPLLREYLRCDPDLWGLSVLRQPRGTNFPVTEREWRAVEGWLEQV